MQDLPEYKPELPKYEGKYLPFDIEAHLNNIRQEYRKHYNSLFKQVQDAISADEESELVIKTAKHWGCNDHHLDVPPLMERAVENFRYYLTSKGYPNEYTQESKRHGNDPDDYFDYENWKQLTIKLK